VLLKGRGGGIENVEIERPWWELKSSKQTINAHRPAHRKNLSEACLLSLCIQWYGTEPFENDSFKCACLIAEKNVFLLFVGFGTISARTKTHAQYPRNAKRAR